MMKELTFSGSPITITYSGSVDEIFTPIHSSSCDLHIVDKNILNDLYTAKKDDIIIEIERKKVSWVDGEKVYSEPEKVWEGYMTPNMYSQNLTQNLDNIEVTFIDTVSVMKYYKISDFFNKKGTIQIKKFLNTIFRALHISTDEIYIQKSLTYNNNPIEDLSVQLMNFWDEDENDSTIYDALSDILRLFGKVIYYKNDGYYIEDVDANEKKTYNHYRLGDYDLEFIDEIEVDRDLKNYLPVGGSSDLSIDTTYSKVTAVASTNEIDYSNSVFDKVTYKNRDKYKIGSGNVLLNKCNSAMKIEKEGGGGNRVNLPDQWDYVFNAAYVDGEYSLYTEQPVTGYSNCNHLGSDSDSTDTGSVANYSGVGYNPDGYERMYVKTDNWITAYAPDNGTPPEFMGKDDMLWTCEIKQDDKDKYYYGNCYLSQYKKGGGVNTKLGNLLNYDLTEKPAYSTNLNNIVNNTYNRMYVTLKMSKMFSRTGVASNIDLIPCDNFNANKTTGTDSITGCIIPFSMLSENVTYNEVYFANLFPWVGNYYQKEQRYSKNKIVIKYTIGDDNYFFDGKNWIKNNYRYFHLGKILNDEKIFGNELKAEYIFLSGMPIPNAMTEKAETQYFDKNGQYSTQPAEDGFVQKVGNIMETDTKYLIKTEAGELQLLLPEIYGVGKLYVEVYASETLGSTGVFSRQKELTKEEREGGDNIDRVMVDGRYTDGGYQAQVVNYIACVYGLPYSSTYVKAEHMKIDVQVNAIESNLGNIFDKSDIQYSKNNDYHFYEELELTDFNINTYNELVNNSTSYLMDNNDNYCNPELFSIRPENYVVCKNLKMFGEVRKRYSRQIQAENINIFDKIYSGEIGSNLIITNYEHELKTNRYTIDSIESFNINIEDVDVSDMEVIHIPRNKRRRLAGSITID